MMNTENTPILKGDRVTRKDGRTGTAVVNEYVSYDGRLAVVIRWDGSKRSPNPSFTENLRKI